MMFFDSIYFDDFDDFLTENDHFEHFEITSTLGRFTCDSPLQRAATLSTPMTNVSIMKDFPVAKAHCPAAGAQESLVSSRRHNMTRLAL